MTRLTLLHFQQKLHEFEMRFGKEPLDTHVFASSCGISKLKSLVPPQKKSQAEIDEALKHMSLTSIFGLEIWNDPAVPDSELQIGRLQWQDGQPSKVVTKVVNLNA